MGEREANRHGVQVTPVVQAGTGACCSWMMILTRMIMKTINISFNSRSILNIVL